MGVTIHVNGISNSLVHKGSMGIAKSTVPDVCKTPSPGGPVPVPYPVIISMSNSLAKGTKTVKVDGKKMAAVKGSEFSRCNGDEPGTAGGVKSSTNMKEATWLLYSFDVKLDGKNACRLSDKMMMNHGNTACLSGEAQLNISAVIAEHDIKCAIQKCDAANVKNVKGTTKNARCAKLGTIKHKCVENTLKKNKDCITEQSFNMNRDPPNPVSKALGKKLSKMHKKFCALMGSKYKSIVRRPDVLVPCPSPPHYSVYDAKFPCPSSMDKGGAVTSSAAIKSPPRKGSYYMTPSSKEATDYKRIANGGKNTVLTPEDCKNEVCP